MSRPCGVEFGGDGQGFGEGARATRVAGVINGGGGGAGGLTTPATTWLGQVQTNARPREFVNTTALVGNRVDLLVRDQNVGRLLGGGMRESSRPDWISDR